tara:strand:+ start:1426 stop:1899 length:474 start_codon:yes stop_codon:yes gene_type:complete
MSENTRKQQIDSYNFDKDMKGLVINPRYIIGLQQIVSKLILDASEEQQMQIPDIIAKIEKILTYTAEGKEITDDMSFNHDFERHLYFLMSLIQYFRYEAREQGLVKKVDVEVPADLVESITANAKAINEGNKDQDLLDTEEWKKIVDIANKIGVSSS